MTTLFPLSLGFDVVEPLSFISIVILVFLVILWSCFGEEKARWKEKLTSTFFLIFSRGLSNCFSHSPIPFFFFSFLRFFIDRRCESFSFSFTPHKTLFCHSSLATQRFATMTEFRDHLMVSCMHFIPRTDWLTV